MKILFITLILLLGSTSTSTAKAEEPIAGVSVTIAKHEQYIEERCVIQNDVFIESYSALYSIDSDLVRAVIYGESNGQADAVNRNRNGSTDSGLMQINSINHKWLSEELGITDFMDPEQNIKAGCFILGGLAKKYESSHRVLMCYNMGEKRTRQLWNEGIRSSKYSRRVMEKFEEIRNGRRD